MDSTTGQTSSYLVNVTASVELVARDGTVLYKERRVCVERAVPVDGGLRGVRGRRMAMPCAGCRRDFAQAVVSDMLESFR